ncbi:MAG: hypothetical protein V3T23_08415 [Nitrososphaerales archaeon]
MAEHAPGNKTNADMGQSPADILATAPIVDGAEAGTKAAFREAYVSSDRTMILSKNQPHRADAAFGFYGEHQGNNLYAPPTEFGGGQGQGLFGSSDPFSNPARYGNFGGGGYFGNEGWMYNRGSNANVDHQRIAQCILLYKTEGIVQTIVHLLADFAVENIDLVHEDETVHNFYQAWKTKIRLKERLHRFVVDLLRTGNVFVWTKEAKLKPVDKTAMKRGVAAQLIGDELVVHLEDKNGKRLRDKTIAVELADDQIARFKELNEACHANATAGQVNEVMLGKSTGDTRNEPADPTNQPKQDTGLIPWEYISLNPLQMEPRGSRFANEHYWVMLLSRRDMKPLSRFMSYRYYSDISTTKINLPEIFKGKLQPAKNGSPYAAELRLDEDRLAVIQDITKADYEDWATPQIYPACKEVAFKRMLRQAEVSAAETLKHAITLIKLGDVKEGFIPTEEQIERVAAAVAGGSQVHHLIHDDLIEGQMLQPNVGNIFDPKKYVQVDKDIYAALGVSESVMAGKGSFANSFMSIKLLLEKLETIRCKLEDWLRVEVKKIADAMKFRRLPIIKWGLMNLRDENSERKLWIDLYDRGIVSDESMLEQFGTDFNIETERQKFEKTVKEKENPGVKKDDDKFRPPVMVSRGPFKNGDMEPPKPKPKAPGGTGGRPVKTGKPQTKKRTTKPKGMSAVKLFQEYHRVASSAVKLISESATKLAVTNQGVRDSRSLTKGAKQELEQITTYALAAINPDIELTQDLVYDVLKSDDAVFSTEKVQRIVALYEGESADANTKEERFDLMCNAFAAINADLLEDDENEQAE